MQLAVHRPITEFLILPPFAVIVYSIFREPWGKTATLRSIVLLPCLGAIFGQLSSHYLGLTPAGVAAATVLVLLTQAAIGAEMAPALAIAVLALLLHAEGVTYVLGVLEGTVTIFIVFSLWRQLFAPLPISPQESFGNATQHDPADEKS
jgi:hypothetical protein